MSVYLKVYQGPVSNTKLSLDNRVSIRNILTKLPEGHPAKGNRILNKHKELYFWDFRKMATELLNIGNKVIIQTSESAYGGEVAVIMYDIDGKIGDAIGWNRQWYGEPWNNPVGLLGVSKRRLSKNIHDTLRRACIEGIDKKNGLYLLKNDFDFDILFPTNHIRIRKRNRKERYT